MLGTYKGLAMSVFCDCSMRDLFNLSNGIGHDLYICRSVIGFGHTCKAVKSQPDTPNLVGSLSLKLKNVNIVIFRKMQNKAQLL